MHDWLLQQHGFNLYVVLATSLLAGSVGLPIPEDVPLIVAGVILHHGKADFKLVFIVCYLSILVGDIIIFLLGFYFGPALFNSRFLRNRIKVEQAKRINSSLEKHALIMIFLARHLFYLRTVTFLTCGAFRMKFLRFLLADAGAALISVPLMLYLGYAASEHLEYLFHIISQAKIISLLGMALIIVLALVVRWQRRRTSGSHL